MRLHTAVAKATAATLALAVSLIPVSTLGAAAKKAPKASTKAPSPAAVKAPSRSTGKAASSTASASAAAAAAKSAVSAKASVPPPVVVSEAQMTMATQVQTGRADCEFNEFVSVEPHLTQAGAFLVKFRSTTYTMVPEETTTGAVRLFDKKTGVVWLQIPVKSMLMDSRAGRRLIDACAQPGQRMAQAEADAKAVTVSAFSLPTPSLGLKEPLAVAGTVETAAPAAAVQPVGLAGTQLPVAPAGSPGPITAATLPPAAAVSFTSLTMPPAAPASSAAPPPDAAASAPATPVSGAAAAEPDKVAQWGTPSAPAAEAAAPAASASAPAAASTPASAASAPAPRKWFWQR